MHQRKTPTLNHFVDANKMVNENMNYTDDQLKAALAKMLPKTVVFHCGVQTIIAWKSKELRRVFDTELLHLCWLVEKDLNPEQKIDYIEMLGRGEDDESFYPTIALASDWRLRATALSRVKSIDIV